LETGAKAIPRFHRKGKTSRHAIYGGKVMNLKLAVAGIAILLSVSGGAQSQESITPPGSVCWPLSFSGIVLGVTTSSQVERLLGRGVFRTGEVETDGRYFIDTKGTATLHVISYTDYVVGEVTLSAGIDPAIKPGEREPASSKWFDPEEGFGNWHALRLGSLKEEVLKNLGQPKKKVTGDQWRYDTICACELPEYFTIFFKDDRVIKIVFSAPAG